MTISTPATTSPSKQAPSHLEVNLARLGRNVQRFSRFLQAQADGGKPAALCGVVKKDAYSLGAARVGARLVEAGASMLAVYHAHEAEPIARAGVPAPIMLFLAPEHLDPGEPLHAHARAHGLHVMIHRLAELPRLAHLAEAGGITFHAHPHVDTGMSRGGLTAAELDEALRQIEACPALRLGGVCSHLATADNDPDFAHQQRRCFQTLLQRCQPGGVAHLANTFGTFRGRAFHHGMVRPGLGLLGYGGHTLPASEVELASLEPALRWTSRLVHVQRYPAGSRVGYGATWRCETDCILGVVPVGYADGYPLALSNRGVVRITRPNAHQPVPAPVRGRINMDQMVVDLTDAARGAEPATLENAAVEIYSDDPAAPNALHAMAESADSHCHELLARLGKHLPRVYVEA